jgi:hypothetical protein
VARCFACHSHATGISSLFVRATRMVRVLSRAVSLRRHVLVTWSRGVVHVVRVLLRACRRVVSCDVARIVSCAVRVLFQALSRVIRVCRVPCRVSFARIALYPCAILNHSFIITHDD